METHEERCRRHNEEGLNDFQHYMASTSELLLINNTLRTRNEALEKWGRDMADCIPLASEPFLPYSEVGKRLDWLYNKARTLGLVEA